MTCQRQTRARIRSIDYASTVDPNVVQSRLKSASQRILFFFAVLFPHQSARGYNFNLVSQVCPRFTLNFEMFLFCLLTCFSATCLLIKMLKLNRFKRRFDHLPQPPSLPLIGHSLAFVAWPFSKQNSLQVVKMKMLEYADSFKSEKCVLIWIGSSAKILLLNIQYITKVLKNTQLLNKPWQYRFLSEWLGQGLLIASGARWKKSRRMLNKVFQPHLLEEFAAVFNREGRSLGVKLMEAQDDQGRVGDIYSVIERITLSVICETAMGTRLLNDPNQIERYLAAVKLVSECAMLRANSIFYRWRVIFWLSPKGSKYREALKVLHQFSWDMIWRRLSEVQAERLSSSFVEPKFDEGEKTETADNTSKGAGRSRPMLDTLLNMYLDCSASQCPLIGMSGESTEPTNEGGLSLKQIREEVDTFVFAGFDTTACALSWTVYLLASHPHQQAAVRQELRSVLRKRWPESADALRTANNRIDIDFDRSTLHELRLLEACIHESLRLFSPVPIILREINAPLALQEKDDAESLSPLIVPAPASCAILLQHHHLNEQLHSNAHNFDPGRFLHLNRRDGESIVDESFGRSTANAFDYIPFSAGPRNCIGKQFALMQLKIVLAQLLLAYELTTDLPLPLVKSSFELVQKPAHPLPVHIRPIAENRQTKFQ